MESAVMHNAHEHYWNIILQVEFAVYNVTWVIIFRFTISIYQFLEFEFIKISRWWRLSHGAKMAIITRPVQ